MVIAPADREPQLSFADGIYKSALQDASLRSSPPPATSGSYPASPSRPARPPPSASSGSSPVSPTQRGSPSGTPAGSYSWSRPPAKPREVVLVTGGSGTVGRAVRELVEGDPEARGDREWTFTSSMDADLREYSQVHRLFAAVQPTHVLHLAAVVRGHKDMAKQRSVVFSANIEINQNVLKCAHLFRVHKLVSCLSPLGYPAAMPEDATEGELQNGPPPAAVSGYAHAKRMLDFMTQCMRVEHGVDFVTVCPASVFGPTGVEFSGLRKDGSLFEATVARCLDAKQQGLPFRVEGSGRPVRQLLYSRDLARMLLWALDAYSEGETLNLPGTEVSVGELAMIVAASCGFTGQIVYEADKPDGPRRVTISGAKLQRTWPEYTPTPFRVAVAETMEHYTEEFRIQQAAEAFTGR